MQRKVLVTGGAGFIGSAVCRRLVADGASVLNLDALTYAGNLQSLAMIDSDGTVFWPPIVKFRSTCKIDITW